MTRIMLEEKKFRKVSKVKFLDFEDNRYPEFLDCT